MKTKQEILEQVYVSAKDIKKIIPTLSITKCRELIDDVQLEMENKKLYIPPTTKPKLALTKLVIKKIGI